MKKSGFLIPVFSLLLVFSCADGPGPQSPPPRAPVDQKSGDTPNPAQAAELFDPKSVTKEEFNTAKIEVQELIQKLNGIIRARDYDAWVSYLGAEYFALINSREYLDRINQQPRMLKARITLYNARDYFTNVVVPARANDRVDDIEFISKNRVKAYTINARGERLRLYDLERERSGWKIIN